MSKRARRKKNNQHSPPANTSQSQDQQAPTTEKLPSSAPQGTTSLRISQTQYMGPIPPPEMLLAFNAVVPNAAERILAMAESQHRHRIEMEKQTITAHNWKSKAGLISGFIVAMTGIIVGALVVATSNTQTQQIVGSVITGVPLASIVGIFVYANYHPAKESEKKPPQDTSPSAS